MVIAGLLFNHDIKTLAIVGFTETFVQLIFLFISIALVEKALKSEFDENGVHR